MENWNQDQPERYSTAPLPWSWKVAESMYKYFQTHIEVVKLCISKSANK